MSRMKILISFLLFPFALSFPNQGRAQVSASTTPKANQDHQVKDPFFAGDDDALNQARIQTAQEALKNCRILARGKAGLRVLALIGIDDQRRLLLEPGESLVLGVGAQSVTLQLVTITRQNLIFTLPDGTRITLQ